MFVKKEILGLIPLLAATAACAQSDVQPTTTSCGCPHVICGLPAPTTGAYNAPAQISTKCPNDIWASAGFIYWQALQSGMEVIDLVGPQASGIGTDADTQGFDFEYKPGFTVSLGTNFSYDNWDLFADYTWYHTGKMTTKVSAPGDFTGFPVTETVLISDEFNTASNFASKTWNLKADFADLMLARSYYVGKKLQFRPSFGPRAAWIRQKMSEFQTSNADFVIDQGGIVVGATTETSNSTVSWAYGLKGALETTWILCSDFSMFGYAGADILYTRYNLLSRVDSDVLSVQANDPFPLDLSETELGLLRPHAEIELGFDYGSYFDNCRWYFDLAVSYNFQVFWSQNMFLENGNSSLPAGELFLHGLNVTASLAF